VTSPGTQGVALPRGFSASSFFHHVLHEATAAFPAVLGPAKLPASAGAFKKRYADALVRFEAARAGAEERVDIARFIASRTHQQLQYVSGDRSVPLHDHLAERAPLPTLTRTAFEGRPGLVPEVPFQGRVYRGREVLELAELLRERRHITIAGVAALRWIVERCDSNGGTLDLRGHRFAVLGAGAELSPAGLWLRAGAEVLWIDLQPPSVRIGDLHELAGTLVQSPANDLLKQPRELLAALRRFAEAGPVHLCMLAYAGGASQEWRLGAAMNAIARRLDPRSVQSLSCFVSPTTAAHVYPEDIEAAKERFAARPGWHSALMAIGALPTPGHVPAGEGAVARAIVSIQGLSYQAAQYVSKMTAAETFAVYGLDLEGEARRPVTVSANVAGITRTRSLSHPVFQAAFVGAPSFGVQIFEPETTRALNGLLILHDVLNPHAPGAAGVEALPTQKARALLSQQVHGGIYCLPYALEPAIRAAAVIGMGKKPSVLFAR
jgi:hypothetical protein